MYEQYSALKIERRGRILVITLDNPPMNAMHREMHKELSLIFPAINNDPETAVVVLTGAGEKAFSAGGDIKKMVTRIEERRHDEWQTAIAEAKAIVYGLLRLEKPLITRINGHAMGLGATLAVYADFSYMMADAKIADTHVKVGLTAGDGGALLWPLLIGFNRARKHLLTGTPLTGSEAAEAGLITEAVKTLEELDQKVFAMAEELAAGASLAINTTKMAINLLLRKSLEGLIETHLGFETSTFLSNDHYEATLAFRDRRTPKFTGS